MTSFSAVLICLTVWFGALLMLDCRKPNFSGDPYEYKICTAACQKVATCIQGIDVAKCIPNCVDDQAQGHARQLDPECVAKSADCDAAANCGAL